MRTLEFERLVELLARMGQGTVQLDELQQWLDEGPPAVTTRLTDEHIKLFLHEAVGVAASDGDVDSREIETIKRLAHRCFVQG